MKRSIWIITTVLILLVVGVAQEQPKRTCQIIDGVEAGIATQEEMDAGDVSLRCVTAGRPIHYFTVPANEYTWRVHKDIAFEIPTGFFDIEDGAHFKSKDIEIIQNPRCKTADQIKAEEEAKRIATQGMYNRLAVNLVRDRTQCRK